MSQTTGIANQRDEKGRFVKGNTCGRGNPFARQTAQLRKAFVDMVSEEDVRDIVAILLLLAKGGDLAAARVVLSYAVGKPTEAENPDRLDVQEWERWREQMTDPRDNMDYAQGMPVQFLNDLAGPVLDARRRYCGEEYLGLLKESHPDEYEQVVQQRQTEEDPAPSVNGPNGDNPGGPARRPHRSHKTVAEQSGVAPSTNGGNGHQRARSAPSTNHGGDGEHEAVLAMLANCSSGAGQAAFEPSTNGGNGRTSRRSGPSANGG
jgi:hypothetical protein